MAPKNVILAALAALILPAVCLQAQTRSLIYNATNGEVITATNVVWTNSFSFSTNTVAASVRANLGLGATWLTNTNVTNFRTAVGLGVTNDVEFNRIQASGSGSLTNLLFQIGAPNIGLYNAGGPNKVNIVVDGTNRATISVDGVTASKFNGGLDIPAGQSITFGVGADAATTRTNLGLPLATLTNDSNVTMMRALSGSTNTNHPFSGTISFQDFSDNTHTISISNGVVTSYEGP